jgi:hypothetical protein
MSQYEMQANSGSLFKNNSKRDGKKDPDAQGKLLLGRELIEALYSAGGNQLLSVSAWTKTKKDSPERWQSLSVRQWLEKGASAPAQSQQPAFDDDIPF